LGAAEDPEGVFCLVVTATSLEEDVGVGGELSVSRAPPRHLDGVVGGDDQKRACEA
jgi:uncharacterized protein (DUF2237 family)